MSIFQLESFFFFFAFFCFQFKENEDKKDTLFLLFPKSEERQYLSLRRKRNSKDTQIQWRCKDDGPADYTDLGSKING